MATGERSQPSSESPGQVLRRILKQRKKPWRTAATEAQIGERRFLRLLKGTAPLHLIEAQQIADACGLSSEESREIQEAIRFYLPPPRPNDFGKHLKVLRKKAGMTMISLAEACKLHQPQISEFENGQLVPSPKMAVILARALTKTSEEMAHYFRVYAGALRNRPDLPNLTTMPELNSLFEWLLLLAEGDFTNATATVGKPLDEVWFTEEAVKRIQVEFAKLSELFATQLGTEKSRAPLSGAVLEQSDGSKFLLYAGIVKL